MIALKIEWRHIRVETLACRSLCLVYRIHWTKPWIAALQMHYKEATAQEVLIKRSSIAGPEGLRSNDLVGNGVVVYPGWSLWMESS